MGVPVEARTAETTAQTDSDRRLVDLVDALVEAVDLNRDLEVDRVRDALEPFGAAALFDAELRLNGSASTDGWCICGGEEVS